MENLNLPTDNLYKFIALSGIIIYLFVSIYPRYLSNNIKDEITLIKIENGNIEFEIELLEEMYGELMIEIAQADSALSGYKIRDSINTPIVFDDYVEKLRNSDNREYLKFVFEYRDELIPGSKILDQITKKGKELKEIGYEIRRKNHQLGIRSELIAEKDEDLRNSFRWWILGSFVGIIMVVSGFSLWYHRLQKYLDQQLKNEVIEYNKEKKQKNTGMLAKNETGELPME